MRMAYRTINPKALEHKYTDLTKGLNPISHKQNYECNILHYTEITQTGIFQFCRQEKYVF